MKIQEENQLKYHQIEEDIKKNDPPIASVIGKDDEELTDKEKKSEKKNKIIIIVLASVFVVILLVVLFIFLILPKLSAPENVIVPDCKGVKVSTCEKKLQKAGFEVNTTIKSVESEKIKKNLVVKTSPEAGRSIKKNSKVTIYKSIGEEVYKLEDYTGKDANVVKTLLETKYKITVTIEKKELDEDDDKEYDDNEIIGQSLAEGSEVKKGDALILYIPKNDAVFPDFASEGYSKDDVSAFCDKYGLNCTYNAQETTSVAEGKIISQSRLVGSAISKGSNLTVVYAVKPKEKTPTPTPTPSATPSSSSDDTNSKDDD